MQTFRIDISKTAYKFLKKQDEKQRLRLYKAIYKLPDGSDIKALSGTDFYRLRVGDCRVIYRIDTTSNRIWIENINNRGDVYKHL